MMRDQEEVFVEMYGTKGQEEGWEFSKQGVDLSYSGKRAFDGFLMQKDLKRHFKKAFSLY